MAQIIVQRQESETSCICVLGVSVMYLCVTSCICVRGIDFASFYDFDIWIWNYPNSVVFFVFHFIRQLYWIMEKTFGIFVFLSWPWDS